MSRLRLPYQPKTACTHVPNPGSATATADALGDELFSMMQEEMVVDEEVVDVDEASPAAGAEEEDLL